jgi:hypothetical protein
MIDKEKATVTMSLRDYEDLVSNGQFWQEKYSKLYRLVRQHAAQINDGTYYIPKSNYEPLVNAIEEYLHDCDI